MRKVTDPDLLMQLESDEEAPSMGRGLKPVQDENVLRQLNAKEGFEPIEFNPSFAEKLAPNVLAGLAQLGHGIINAPHNLVNLVSPKAASYIPKQQDYDFSAMLKLPGTSGDKFVQSMAKFSPTFAMGGVPLGAAGNVISKIPMAGNFLSGALSRAIPQVGFGAAVNENPAEGAKEMAIGQGIGELLPGAFKAVGKTAEFLNPKKYATQLGEIFAKDYARAKSKAGELYNAVTKRFGGDNIYKTSSKLISGGEDGSKNYMALDQDVINKYFTPSVKKLHEDFMENPTLSNAHKLQSQMGSEAAKLTRKNPDAITHGTVQSLEFARDVLNQDIKSFLQRKDPGALNMWEEGTKIFREEAAPYRSNPTVYKLAEGKKKTISPARLTNALTDINEAGRVPEGHYLSKALEDLSKKVNRGKAFQDIGSTLGGLAIGEMVAPGIGGGAAGAALGKFLSPTMVKIAQNPYLVNAIKRLNLPYEITKKSIIANNLSNEQ